VLGIHAEVAAGDDGDTRGDIDCLVDRGAVTTGLEQTDRSELRHQNQQ
jgi:hypothetical protein